MYKSGTSAYYTSANAYTTYWTAADSGQDYAYSVSLDPSSSTVRPAQSTTHDTATAVRCVKDY